MITKAEILVQQLCNKARTDKDVRTRLERLADQLNYTPTGMQPKGSTADKEEFLLVQALLDPNSILDVLEPRVVEAPKVEFQRVTQPVTVEAPQRDQVKEISPSERKQPTLEDKTPQAVEVVLEAPPLPVQEETRIRNCETCGVEIPYGRLEALPNTRHCVKCSKVKGAVGFMVFDHKTAPYLVTVDAEDEEALRQAQRANRRAR